MNNIFRFCLFSLFFGLLACDGNNSSAPNEDQSYSSEHATVKNSSSSAQTTYSSDNNKESLSSSSTQADYSGEKIVCKGPYSNMTIDNIIYLEAYHCEDGNTCAPHIAAACSETECRSINLYACKDNQNISEEQFNKKYVLDTCQGGYCKVYCYNNEIALDDGDTLKVIECENGLTYLRDGALDRKRAGKSIPDTILESPQRGANCDYGERLCANTTEEGHCYMYLTTIECPRKEQQD